MLGPLTTCAAIVLALVTILLPGTSEPAAVAQTDQLIPEMIHGVIVDTTNPTSMRMAREAGFTHAKMILYWPRLEPRPGQFMWRETSENDLDNVLKATEPDRLQLVLRIDEVPGWAGGSPSNVDLNVLEAF